MTEAKSVLDNSIHRENTLHVEDFFAALRRGDKKVTHPLKERGVYVRSALPKSNTIDHKRIRRYLRSRENVPIYIVAGEGTQTRVYQVIKQSVNDIAPAATIFVQDFDNNYMVQGYIGKRDTSNPVTRPIDPRNPQLGLRTLFPGDSINIWLRDDAIEDVLGLYLPQKSLKNKKPTITESFVSTSFIHKDRK